MNDSDVLDVNEFYSRLRSANNVLYLNNETLQSVMNSLESFARENPAMSSETYEAAKSHILWYALTIQLFIDINNQEMDIIKNLIDQSIEISNIEQSTVYSDCIIYGSDVNYNINRYRDLINDCNADITKEKAKLIPNPWSIYYLKAERENYKDILEAYEEVRDAYDNFQNATSTVLVDDVTNPIYAAKEQIYNTLDSLRDSYDPTTKTYSVPEGVKDNIASAILALRDSYTNAYRNGGEIDLELVIEDLSESPQLITLNDIYGLANVLLSLGPEDLQTILNDSRVNIETLQCVAFMSSQLAYTDYQIDNGENCDELRKEYINTMALLVAAIEINKTRMVAEVAAVDALEELKKQGKASFIDSYYSIMLNVSITLDDNGYYAINIDWDGEIASSGQTYTYEELQESYIAAGDFSDINEVDRLQDEYNVALLQNATVDISKRIDEFFGEKMINSVTSQLLALIPGVGGGVSFTYFLGTDTVDLIKDNTCILVNNSYLSESIETTEMINIYQSLGCNSGTYIDTGNSVLLTDVTFSKNAFFLYTASYLNENGSGFSSADVNNQMKNILLTVESEDEQSAFGQYYKWFGKSLNSRTAFEAKIDSTYTMLRDMNSDISLPYLDSSEMTVEQLSEIVDYMNDGNIDNFDVSIFVQE